MIRKGRITQFQAEASLKASELIFRSVIEESADGIVLVDEQGSIFEWNHGEEIITGLSRDEVIGQPVWDVQFRLAPPELNTPQLYNHVKSAMGIFARTGQASWMNQLQEQEIVRLDGRRRITQTISFPIPTKKGFFSGSITRDITESKEMENTLRRRADELAALHTVSLNINAARDLPALLQTVVEQATHLLKGEGGGFYLCDLENQAVYLAVAHNLMQNFIGTTLKFGEGIAGRVAQTASPMIVEDYHTWSDRAAVYESEPIHAVISTPVIWQKQVKGVLHVFHNKENRHFNQADLELLTLFANQAAIALENARLLEAERQDRQEAETLRQAATALASTLNLSDVLDSILIQLERVVPYDSATVFLLDEDRLFGKACRGIPERDSVIGQNFPAGDLLFSEAQRTGRSLILQDAQCDERFHNWAGTDYVHGWMGIPLILRGITIGFLTCDNRQTAAYDQVHAELAEAFANQAAVAIENARLFAQRDQRAAELEAIRQASLSLTASLELPQVLNAILQSALSLLPEAYSSYIYLYEPEGTGRLTFGAAIWADGTQNHTLYEPRPQGMTYRVAQLGEPIVISDISSHPLFKDALFDPVGAIIGLPLKIGARVVGVMNVTFIQPRQISESEQRLLRLLADQAAIAIENAGLFEQAATERRHLGLLYEISKELAGSIDPDETLNRAISLTCQALGGLMGIALLYVPRDNRLSLRALYSIQVPSLEELNRKLDLRIGYHLVGWAAQQDHPVNVPDVSKDEHWVPVQGLDDEVRSAIAAPIRTGGELLGVLIVYHRQLAAFSDNHVSLLRAICQEVGLALSNARRYQEIQRRLAEMTLIQDLTQVFNQRLEVQNLLDEVVTQLANKLGYPQVRINLVEEDHLVLKAYYGPRPKLDRYPLEQGIIGQVARTGQAVLAPDVSLEPDYRPCIGQTIAELAVPIFRGKSVVGVINIETDQKNQLSEQDRDLLQVLAGQISVALENAVLFERVRSHAEDLESKVLQRTAELSELFQLSQAIGYQLSYEELLRLILNHLSNAIRAEFVIGCLVSQDACLISVKTNRPIASALLEDIRLRWVGIFSSYGIQKQPSDQTQVEILYGAGFQADSPPIEYLYSVVQAPVFTGQDIAGILLGGCERPDAFGAEQERLLNTFANQASAAFQRLQGILAVQQRQLESLVEHLPIGVLLLDTDFNLLVANPVGREILNVLNRGNGAHPLTGLGDLALRELINRKDDPLPVEITLNGHPWKVFSAQIRQVGSSPDDSVIEDRHRWILTIQDVTQERETQSRIQSQDRLATVGQLAAGIAHDFNNIMAAILVYTDLLRFDPNIPSTSQEKLGIIQQQVQRAASLIRQILDFSRKSVMEQSTLDLLPFVKELDKMLGRVLPETIRMELTYQPGVYWVNADPTRLQQVFMNLALNARDAMPKGGTLYFSLDRLALDIKSSPPIPGMPPGDWIKITISDTGLGISPDVRDHIFEPFFTTKPAGQGTGLGLAQVYGIIKQHDGFIDVLSQAGDGTTFRIFLPAVTVMQKQPEYIETQVPLNGHEETILIVEDDLATREALEALLQAHNYKVLSAENGIQALTKFEENSTQIALVITDMVMPEMGGNVLFRTLRSHWPQVKMLFITGHPMEEENQSMLESGNLYWLQKPFTARDLTKIVNSLLRE